MKISVITPTEERSHFLKSLYGLLKAQTFTNWEWLIYDTSLRPAVFSDNRVHVQHEHHILSVGEKRNRLIEKATGDVIVHFDDDDYYAPRYLEKVCEILSQFEFFTFHSWFSYHLQTKQFYYWDTDEEGRSHYVVDPLTEMHVREIDLGPHFSKNAKESINEKGKRGYGFSFAYLKKVWQACPFPDADLDEDRVFFDNLTAKNFAYTSEADEEGRAVHVVHSTNLSRVYPQYRIPLFMVKSLLGHFMDHLEKQASGLE